LAIPDLLGGRITMMFSPVSIVLPLVRDGKLRALAVTSLKAFVGRPGVANHRRVGLSGVRGYPVVGLLAPARMPAMIVGKVHLETVKMLGQADVRAKLADLGFEIIGNSPDEFAAVIKSETPKWAKLIKESGIKPDLAPPRHVIAPTRSFNLNRIDDAQL